MTAATTVLYVEDDVSLRGLVTFWLEEAGYRVVEAGDGLEALEAIARERPDLVITDAMMPNMSGDELVEAIKSDPELRSLPVVMATAAASPLRRERMRAAGCYEVLAKPLDEHTFLRTAREALATASAVRPSD